MRENLEKTCQRAIWFFSYYLHAEGQNYEISYVEGTLTILPPPLIPGDASGDNNVDAGDVVAITDYMVGKEPEKFSTEAADMNGDNAYNIADIIQIVNKILDSK